MNIEQTLKNSILYKMNVIEQLAGQCFCYFDPELDDKVSYAFDTKSLPMMHKIDSMLNIYITQLED